MDSLDSERNETLALETAEAFKQVTFDPESSPTKSKGGAVHYKQAKENLDSKVNKREEAKDMQDRVERMANDLVKGNKTLDDDDVKRTMQFFGIQEDDVESEGE